MSESLRRVCDLCGYRIGQHMVPPYGVKVDNPTGLMCPSDARLDEKLRLPVRQPLSEKDGH